jgi:hypothetical protein
MSTLLAAALLAAAPATDLEAEAQRLLVLADVSVQSLRTPVLPEASALIDIELGDLPFTLDLWKDSQRTPGYQLLEDTGGGNLRVVDPGPVRTFRGTLVEDPGSVVAGSLLDDGLYAKIMLTSGDMYWIEPLVGRTPNASFGDHALYHQDDVLSTPGLCGVDRLADGGPELGDPPGESISGTGYPWVAELGCDADFQFYNSYGSVSGVENRIHLVINTMNTQFEDEVRITHLISVLIVRTTSGGGGYTSNNPGLLLSQFRTEWGTNQAGQPRDVAQLFTGKNLTGNIIGIAYPAGICSPALGYNLVQSNCCGSLACATDLSAHELGHTWNAGHCSCSGWTMNPSLTCSNRFHDESTEPRILMHRDSRDCLHLDTDGDLLFYENFETGKWTTSGWVISSTARCVVKKSASYERNYGAKLKKGGQGTPVCTLGSPTWAEAPAVDTTGYSTVRVLMNAHVRNNTLGCEYLDVQWWDGATWASAGQVEKHAWDFYEITLPAGAAGNPNLRVRLETNCKGSKERAEFDNFCIIGS